MDYEQTLTVKLKIARSIFDRVGLVEIENSTEYESFKKANDDWLIGYAVFCWLRDLFKSSEHWTWGSFANPSKDLIHRLADPEQEWHNSIEFYCFLQYKLHQQLLQVSQEAKKIGVVLKGDLPIGVDKRSVDTWLNPHLFRMDTSTGAPPDYFDPGGQNWGFPTYNWEAMSKDGFAWWRRRLSFMAQYFQAYRIDHILGFFRIWELPASTKSGLLGRFRPSLAYSRQELESKGMWDIDRLCEPYITDDVLHAEVDDRELETEVKERFFIQSVGNRYKFREKYSSELSLWNLRSRPGLPEIAAEETRKIQRVLISLFQNVVLVRDRDEPTNLFYPRFGLSTTSSFANLETHWQDCLKSMHDESFYGLRSDSIWREQAYKTLPVMQNASDMLVCGEDLGMIPPCVHPVMKDLGIIGLRIQRMPSEEGLEFGNPGLYPYSSVASPSSHDTTTFRAWYEEDSDRQKRYCSTALGLDDQFHPCDSQIVKTMIKDHLECPSVLTIFSIQDILAVSDFLPSREASEETINVPSNPDHYWRYRMHVTVEDMEKDANLQKSLRSMICASGRLVNSSYTR